MLPHKLLLSSIIIFAITATFSARSVYAQSTIDKIIATLKENEEKYIDDLKQLVAFPSVSANPANQADILRAADWLVARLNSANLQNVRILQTKGPRPSVYADYIVDKSLPTGLLYGHYDTQPAEPFEAWSSPPFEAEVRNGAVFGRGASDDKGGILGAVQALEAILKIEKTLPLNVKLMIEGEEEMGSPYLEPFLEEYADVLACDFAISADGGQVSSTQPGMTLGLRGAASLEIEVSTLARDVHSGFYGGAVQNPIRALTQLLNTMFDPVTNKILVKGYYDKVQKISAEDRDDILAANYDETKELVDAVGALEPLGEEGYSTLERIWFRPTLEIVGIAGGYAGPGVKTVLPSTAIAKLAARLVPGQTPSDVLALIEAHIQDNHPPACNVTVRELGFKAMPFKTERNSPVNAAAARVLEKVIGKPPLYVRNGATIPAMAAFQTYLGAETTSFGFALPSDTVHAPDERYQLSQYAISREAYVRFLYELGEEIKSGRLKKKESTGSAGNGSDKTEL